MKQGQTRLLDSLAALGLLYIGIDRMFFDRIAGDDALSLIQRILAVVVGLLLITLGVSLFVVAWRGRPPVDATDTNAIKNNLLTHAYCAAPSALVFGVFLIRSVKELDIPDVTVAVLSGVSSVFVLFRTNLLVRRLASGETLKKNVRQFLWSCIFFNMLSCMFGMAVSGYTWFSTDFLQKFGVIFWGAMTAIATYPVHRDAKRLAGAVGQTQLPSD
jgi:hypothetical protein